MRALKSLVIATFVSAAAVANADALFTESFENGSSAWTTADGNPITLQQDTATCSTTYQHETTVYGTGTGRVGTKTPLPVTSGADYCLSAWIRTTSDSTPFVGIDRLDSGGNSSGQVFPIGSTYYGSSVDVVGDDQWHWYAAQFTVDANITQVTLQDMLFTGSGYADFDDIQVTAGACPSRYVGPDQHMTCGGATPYCASNGACGACDGSQTPTAAGNATTCSTWCAADGDCGTGQTCDTTHNLCTNVSTPSGGDTGGTSSGAGATPATPTGNVGAGPVANQVGNPQPVADTPAAPAPMDPPTQMNAVSMGGGCSLVRGVGDEGFAMGLLCVAMLALLLRRNARR